jgi:predicted nucleic acid-binding protein
MVLVDSSVWVEALRRNGRLDIKLAVEGLLDVDEAQWCSPARLEVLGGARPDERRRLGDHFSAIPYRACDEQDWDRAILLAGKLRDNGFAVPWLDVVIASLAVHDGIRLFTIDEHFKKITTLTGLALYEPGYGGMFRPK